MEITPRLNSPIRKLVRGLKSRGTAAALLIVAALLALPTPADANIPLLSGRHSREHFRKMMPQSVRGDHPAIQPVVAAIRRLSSDPLEQIAVVNDVSHLLVDYDHDERVWGQLEFHATFEEMLARRRQSGWLYLRDDCDGRAVFAAHLLAALGIPWRLEASYWKEHAWIVARVNGVDYDLLDLRRDAPETNRLSYKLFGRMFVRPSQRPPAFSWRRAWAQRTGRDFHVGLTLGLLSLDSTPTALRERFATDWTQRAPHGRLSPVDDRVLTAHLAGFPYGEPLHSSALASGATRPTAEKLPVGVPTASPNSARN